MNEPELKLAKPPIVEAVVDIDCDMPPTFDLAALESPTRATYGPQYPKFRTLFVEQHRIEAKGAEPSVHSTNRAVQALQFLHADEKQLVQVRAQGFSFNRLDPYTSLDDYLPEIERTWRLFLGTAAPVLVRGVRLRYINRIPLPLAGGSVKLNDYLKNSPQLPDEDRFTFVGFLNQHVVEERNTGHQANIVLTTQMSENDMLPIIFDNCVAATGASQPENWAWILEKIHSLRGLKNQIFKSTLTEKCLNLFQQ